MKYEKIINQAWEKKEKISKDSDSKIIEAIKETIDLVDQGTIRVAEKKGKKWIDMDYNEDESYKSHKLISAAKGWANSLGYKVNVKPNNQIATRAADYHCK